MCHGRQNRSSCQLVIVLHKGHKEKVDHWCVSCVYGRQGELGRLQGHVGVARQGVAGSCRDCEQSARPGRGCIVFMALQMQPHRCRMPVATCKWVAPGATREPWGRRAKKPPTNDTVLCGTGGYTKDFV